MKKRSKKPRLAFKCSQCKIKYATSFAFSLHMHMHESCKNSWFPCRRCGRKFSKIVSLLKHRAIHPPPVKGKILKDTAVARKKQNGTLA